MLGNSKKDFVQEILLTIVLMFTFSILTVYFADIYPKNTHYSILNDFITIFILSFFVFFGIIRIIRYAYVMRGYVLLYFPYLIFTILVLFIGVDTFQKLQGTLIEDLNNMIPFLIILTSIILYTVYIYIEKKRGLFKKTVPSERIQVLLMVLTRKQKLTLVFPDRYIKYLETGDERYLKDEKIQEERR